MKEHTETPWRVIDGHVDNFYGVQMGKDGGFMLHPDIPDAKVKANLIVLACNHHEELVEVLQKIITYHEYVDQKQIWHLEANAQVDLFELLRDTKALLFKIEGERT